MKTLDVLQRVLAGKRMSESSRQSYKRVFGSVAKMFEEFPGRSTEVNEWLVSLDGFDEVVGDMFPEIREGVVVRPSLGMEDLSLIRKGFIEMAVSDRYSRDVGKAKDLMKRMLRKAG